MSTTTHLDKLNAAQRKAVTHGEALPEKGYRAGPLLIVAGAGTGKTDTLAHRVAHLVIHGVDPARILMLTFTRRAALEMRRRAHQITRLYRAYVEQKQHASLLDYDDLLLYWHAMMSEPRLAQHIGAHFDHVLVDEYQDTNRLQAEILHALKPDGAGVAVVGDDAQAIYSFRAAAVENILGFPERFQPPANVVTLAQNYRSTQQVLDVANALLAEAPRQHRKYLLSIRSPGARPRLVTVEELQTQAEYVVTEVPRRREANVPLKRQAVLFRSASHSDLLEVELAKRNVPFVKYGGLRFLEAAHVKDLMAVLRWADNPRNTLAAFRTLQLLPGVGPVNARLAIEHLETAGHTFEALEGFRPPETGAAAWERLTRRRRSLAAPER